MKKCWHHLLYADVINFFVTRKCQKIQKMAKIINIDGENFHIFWMTWRILMKFSGKMWRMIILKVTKNQGFTLSLERECLTPPSPHPAAPPAVSGLNGRKKIMFKDSVCDISSVPARNYLVKGSIWSTWVRCENCSRLIMGMLDRWQWRGSSVLFVNCEHIPNTFLIVDFEQAYWNEKHFWEQEQVYHALCCSI